MKYRFIRALQHSAINTPVRLAWRLGLSPPGDALLETVGRRSGLPRQTPICDGLEGDTFWIIVQHGRRSDYVRNIEANPLVRVRTGSRSVWRTGTAHILDHDDARERMLLLSQADKWRKLCLRASHGMRTSLLTIRIDLDPADRGTSTG